MVPVVIGAFLGAPLLARELADGTWQLAWTQAVPRMRWLAAKLAALAGVTVTLTGMFTAVLTWFRQPFDAWEGRFQYDAFDLEGLVPVAYALFAFGVATAAGAILRRMPAARRMGWYADRSARGQVSWPPLARAAPSLVASCVCRAANRSSCFGAGDEPGYDYGDKFLFGLDLVLDGLEHARRSVDVSTPRAEP